MGLKRMLHVEEVSGPSYPSFVHDRHRFSLHHYPDLSVDEFLENAAKLEQMIEAVGSEHYVTFLRSNISCDETDGALGYTTAIYAHGEKKPIRPRDALQLGQQLVSAWGVRVDSLEIPEYCDTILPITS